MPTAVAPTEEVIATGGVVGAVTGRPRRGRESIGAVDAIEAAPPVRTPLRIEFTPPPPGADPDLASLFVEELTAALVATQQFDVVGPTPPIAPAAPGLIPGGPGGDISVKVWADDQPQAVLRARVIDFVPYQPMRLRAEFTLEDPLSGAPPVQLQGTWEPPPFPPGPVVRHGRWRTERLPVQIAEEEQALIATSPRFFCRFAAGEVAGALTDAFLANQPDAPAPIVVETWPE